MLKIAIFCHSLVSDWNHGNAHFLRGVASDLGLRGHLVQIFEPADNWSRKNLVSEYGEGPVRRFHTAYPALSSTQYDSEALDFDRWLDGVDVVLMHEWNDPSVIAAAGRYRRRNRTVRLFFHDTHHRAITAPNELARFDLSEYDAVLAYGASLKEAYDRRGWGRQVFVWNEAADTRIFRPHPEIAKDCDLVWIGNWGDEERTEELAEFLMEPSANLRLCTNVYGVRYPESAKHRLAQAGITYNGWLANFDAPQVFARHRVTVHVPRRPYVRQLAGIPTIRPFEALACGIPLVSSPWMDSEGLFRTGIDYLTARNGGEMTSCLRDVVNDGPLAASVSAKGLETILARHTCNHRVDELLSHYAAVAPESGKPVDVEEEVKK